MTITLIDNLDFNNLDKYQSRSLVAWLKRNTGSEDQKKLVKKIIEDRGQNVLERLRSRVQVNYRLSIETTEKLSKICKKIGCYKTIKINDESIYLESKEKKDIQPIELAKVLLEESIEDLYNKVQNEK
tara:strand:- start:639 stop:1022 length:384 start_codon:yes stop_codon:yes gene_type:complete